MGLIERTTFARRAGYASVQGTAGDWYGSGLTAASEGRKNRGLVCGRTCSGWEFFMFKRFDIFLFGEMGPTWVDAVETFEDAKSRIDVLLGEAHSGDYAIIDLNTGKRIFLQPNNPASVVKRKAAAS